MVSIAAVFCASFRRLAIIRRKRDIGTRSSRASLVRGPAGAGAVLAAGAAILADPLAIAFCTSALVRRPSFPVPEIAAGLRLFSSTSLRTAGDNTAAAAEAAAAGAGAAGAGVAVGAGAGAVFAAGLAAGAAPSSTNANSASTPTVSPSFATISANTPFTGDGTSNVTLSVSSSTIASSAPTASPADFIHLATVASTTDSPRTGTLISTGIV